MVAAITNPLLTRIGLVNVMLMEVLTKVIGLATLTVVTITCLCKVSEPDGNAFCYRNRESLYRIKDCIDSGIIADGFSKVAFKLRISELSVAFVIFR